MKKIIHIDADCFYAAIEIRENPKLASEPVAVGGSPDRRGVIATCNYFARKYGVHSAMSSAHALKLCPELKIIAPRISLYKEYSVDMRNIFSEYTEQVEPLSLDEAYLDVSTSSHFGGSATLIAREIKSRIFEKLGISVSAGVAPVKYLAKIASDWEKPNGLYVITPEKVPDFVLALPLRKLPGVGPVTADKLARNGLNSCEDVQNFGLEQMIRTFGAYGQRIFSMSRGIDNRTVAVRRDRKSISVEKTYERDILEFENLLPNLSDLLKSLTLRFSSLSSSYRIQKAFVKMKFNDFSITTVEANLDAKQDTADAFQRLALSAWRRGNKPARLLGLGYRLQNPDMLQLELPFPEEEDIRSV